MFFVPLNVTQFQDTTSANVNLQHKEMDAAAVLYPEFVRTRITISFRKCESTLVCTHDYQQTVDV